MASKTTATKVINAAKAEISAKKYTRPNKYTKWYYGNNTCAPWCGIFIAYIIKKVCGDSILLKGLSNPAGVGYIYNWAKSNNYIKYSGKKGDLVIFDWTCGNGVANKDHVGFFVKDNGNGTITTIEGNTSSVSDGNGDHVQQRVRDKKWVQCYVRLPYKKESSTTSVKKTYTGQYPTSTVSLEKGTKANIKNWQKFLNWYGDYGLKVDGVFGTMSYKATKEFQKEQGLAVDGICGPKTIIKAKEIKK